MKNIFDRCIYWLFNISFVVVLMVLIFFHIYTKFSFHFLLSNAILLFFSICFLFVIKIFFKKKKLRYSKILFISFTFLLFLFELLMLRGILFRPGWDAGMIIHSAYDNVLNKTFGMNRYYFDIYPNNLVLLFYEMIVALFVNFIGKGMFTFNFIMVLINIIIFVISGVFVYYCIKKVTNHDKISFLGFIIYCILIGTSGWVLVPYTDSIGMLAPILFLFLLVYWKDNTYKKWIIISCLSFFAFHIKPQLIIMFIAFVIVEFLYMVFDKDFKNVFKYICIVIGCFILINLGYSVLERRMQLDSNKSFGISHFLMMGLNYEQCGVYSEDDVNFSRNIIDANLRKKENLRIAKERIFEYGPLKLVRHFRNKILVNFDDGTFFFGGEGHFYEHVYIQNNNRLSFLKEFIYSDGRFYDIISTVRQFFWIFILMLLPINLFKNNSKEIFIAKLALIGLFLFELIFEARSRYLFSYVPIFIFIAMYHMYYLFNKK